MATHDYIISNASGASVRADLNNALAAIVSNNSNATSPATTYAYQWWADTTTGQLKLRNSANSAWITIFELDGTMLMEDGNASTPGLAFADDVDTGIFSPSDNGMAFATGGTERLRLMPTGAIFNEGSEDYDFRVESNGNTHMLFVDAGNDAIGIGTSSPNLNTSGTAVHISNASSGNAAITRYTTGDSGATATDGLDVGMWSDGDAFFWLRESNNIRFATASTERVRIDSSGKLLVGVSSARANFYNSTNSPYIQLEGNDNNESALAIIQDFDAGTQGAQLVLAKNNSQTIGSNVLIDSGDQCGTVSFQGNDGTQFVEAAAIITTIDGTPGANDMPGRLTFLTTADGESSPTERVRIDSSGNVGIGDSSPSYRLDVKQTSAGTVAAFTGSTDGGRPLKLTSADNGIFLGAHWTRDIDSGSGIHAWAVNGSEKARLDSSGRLLIGTTAEGTSSADTLTLAESGNCGITIRSGTSSVGALYYADGTSGDAEYRGYVEYNHSSDYLRIGTASSERLRILSSGGLTFNGDTAAANALDDYEEGTFNLRLNNQNDDATFTFTGNQGYYVKIGSEVHFQVYLFGIACTNTGTTTNARLYGLPFNAGSNSNQYAPVLIMHNNALSNVTAGYVNVNGSFIVPIAHLGTGVGLITTMTSKVMMVAGSYRTV